MSHANISIFVPHLGCPNQCSFCNQRHITGEYTVANAKSVDEAVTIAKTSKNYSPKDTEIAFFGGSFTAIDRDYMLSLLSAAKKYVDNGTVAGIRISTRPDCITDEILKILKNYCVTAIELGAQSLCDRVLSLNKRGHTAKDVENAVKLIRKYDFELGLQMMTGLYGDTREGSLYTANEFIRLMPDTVRIYPTIVIKDTKLADLVNSGEYAPQSLEDAVKLWCELKDLFENANINVIRLGLHSIDEETFVAGPWHPAFAELCESEKYYNLILSNLRNSGEYLVYVNEFEISKAIGHKKSNIIRLEKLGYNVKVSPLKTLNKYEINVCKI